jgi:SAM-dependent methyltransferase
VAIDLDAYRAQSLATWGEMAPGWEDRREWLLDITGRVNGWLVEKADPQPGQAVLEIAAGTGDLGFAVAQRVGDGGRVISSDFSAKMIDVARRNGAARGLSNVEYRVLDAEKMDLGDDSVDGDEPALLLPAFVAEMPLPASSMGDLADPEHAPSPRRLRSVGRGAELSTALEKGRRECRLAGEVEVRVARENVAEGVALFCFVAPACS